MDINTILLWLVSLSCGFYLWRTIQYRARKKNRAWAGVVTLIIAVTAFSYFEYPQNAGIIGGIFWFVLMALPSLGFRLIFWLNLRQRFTYSKYVAYAVRLLHPFDSFWQLPYIMHAHELAQQGRVDQARALVGRYYDDSTLEGRLGKLFLLRVEQRWEEITEIAAQLPPQRLFRDSNLNVFIRALGETGNFDAMIEVLSQAQNNLRRDSMFTLSLLVAAAFCGEKEVLAQLLVVNRAIPEPHQRFWMATADAACGRNAQAEVVFKELLASSDGLIRAAAQRRLSVALPPAALLHPQSRLKLEQLCTTFRLLQRFDAKSPAFGPFVTYGIIFLCCAAYLFEIARGDPTDAEVLIDLGGLVPVAVSLGGEWWRIISAQFLHAGSMHLLFNMLCLYDLGPYVERTLGRWLFLLLYVVCGTLAVGSVVPAAILGITSPYTVVVGASGGIMAILGMNLALLLKAWRVEAAPIAREKMMLLGRIVLLQLIVDAMTPQISSTAHLSGLTAGFLFTLLVPYRSLCHEQRSVQRGGKQAA